MRRNGKNSIKQAEGQFQPDLSAGRADLSTHRNKAHLDARQAEFYAYQLINNKYDSVRYNILITERTAIKIANQLFSEKYGNRRAFLCKPFDTYLFNGNWFVYGPISKSKIEFGPMIVINQYTGETRFKQ